MTVDETYRLRLTTFWGQQPLTSGYGYDLLSALTGSSFETNQACQLLILIAISWLEWNVHLYIRTKPTKILDYKCYFYVLYFQVGSCIVNREKRIISTGYNGMPNGCSDENMPWGKHSPDKLKNKQLYGK